MAIETTAPEYPHFVHMQMEGVGTPILKEHLLVLCENPDPTTGDGKYPMRLVGVNRRKLVFVCGCSNKSCTWKIEFTGNWTGRHPVETRQE